MLNVNIVGSVVASDNLGVGASIGIDLVTRNTSAYVGTPNGTAIPAGTTPASVDADGTITILAETNGLNVGFAVAGAVSTPAKPEPAANAQAAAWTDPAFSLGLPAVNVVESKTGISIAGDAIVNVETDSTLAYINDATSATPDIVTPTLTITSSNSSQTVSVSGAVAYTSAGLTSSEAMAGSFSANAVMTTTDAFIVGANLAAGSLIMDADRTGFVGSITAGFAGAVRPAGVATGVMGSVSVNIVIPHTEAYVSGATLALIGDSHIKANDTTLIWAVTGGGAYGGTGGYGAAIGIYLIGSSNQAVAPDDVATTLAYIHNSQVTMVDGTLELYADNYNSATNPRIIAVTASLGWGSQPASEGIAGMISVNVIKYRTAAYIDDGSSVTEVAAPAGVTDQGPVTLLVHADDTSGIVSIGGAVGIGQAVGVGAALGFNQIHDSIEAYLDDTAVMVQGPVTLSANSKQTIGSVTLGIAAGTGAGFAAAGSASVNNITNTIDAHISGGSNVKANGAIQIDAVDAALLVAITGGVGRFGLQLGRYRGAGVGVAISYTLVSDAVSAFIDSSTVDSVDSGLTLSATSTPMVVAIGAAGGGSTDSIGGAGTIAINSIANEVAAYISGSTITTFGDLSVTASESATLYAFGLAGAGSDTGAAVGAVLAYNYIGGTIDPADPNVISYDDGTIAGTKNPQVTGDDTTTTSNISAFINNSGVQAGGKVVVLAGLQDPDAQADPGSAAAQTLTINPSTAVTLTTDTITFATPHGLNTGDQVIYSNGGGTSVAGLTDATTYYVIRVDAHTIKLAATLADAAAGNAIALTAAGSGASHTLTPANGVPLTFNPATAVILDNRDEDSISFANDPGLHTGDAVVYHNGGGASIGGLTDGQLYYIIRLDSTHFQLAATQNDAAATTPEHIFFTSLGTGSSHTLVQKATQVEVGDVTVPLPTAISGQIVSVTGAGGGGDDSAGAGAVGLNFIRTQVDAHITNALGSKKVIAAGDVDVQAVDTSKIDAGVGSIALSFNGGTAINASVGVNDIRNSIQAYIEGAQVQSTAGSVNVLSNETARSVNIVVGGSGAKGAVVAFGGSIAVNLIKNTVDAHVASNANGSSDVEANKAILVQAIDSAAIASLAGNVAANIGGAGGVGLAFAVNDIGDTVTAQIDNSIARAAGGNLTVDAEFAKPTDLPPGLDVQIAAMAVSGGAPATWPATSPAPFPELDQQNTWLQRKSPMSVTWTPTLAPMKSARPAHSLSPPATARPLARWPGP